MLKRCSNDFAVKSILAEYNPKHSLHTCDMQANINIQSWCLLKMTILKHSTHKKLIYSYLSLSV